MYPKVFILICSATTLSSRYVFFEHSTLAENEICLVKPLRNYLLGLARRAKLSVCMCIHVYRKYSMNIYYFVTYIYKHIVIHFRNVREGKLTLVFVKCRASPPSWPEILAKFFVKTERPKERTHLINMFSISLP